ncbi:MAG: hypothetical protein FWF22_09905 [Treponema sp.]|nr:hypothetical protein [Treponema sp.]
MNARQLYRETILFGNPDKIPLALGGPRESTIKAWKNQGLDKPYIEALQEILGLGSEAFPRSESVDVITHMIPEYEAVILDHRDGHYLVRDHMGATVEISDQFDPSYLVSAKDFVTRKWHKFPVENRDEWLEMKKRYNPEDPARFPKDFSDQAEKWKTREHLLQFVYHGVFWQLREWCGMEGLCMLMLDDPDLVREMADFWSDFMSVILKKLCSKAELDNVLIQEDMAYKAHAMISPAMTREFVQDSYNSWVPIIKKSGCLSIELDSDGYVGEIIPIWIESGINCNSPVEVAAQNDILQFRRKYGKDMAFKGGIDKRIMARGGRELEQHVMSIVPQMFKLGGYIPGCDHGVPPDISWKNFIEFGRLIAKLSGWM